MAATRWEDKPENRQLVDALKRQLAAGRSYQSARAAVNREILSRGPIAELPHSATWRRAEQQARQERLVEGRQAAERTRRRHVEEARAVRDAREAELRRARERRRYTSPISPERGTGLEFREYETIYRDPTTQQQTRVSVLIPMIGNITPQSIAAAMAYAIAFADHAGEYAHIKGIFEAILLAGTPTRIDQ